ncbi:MAG: bifunctional glycosyltransferase/class I SAM-dependent methyltransferase [Polyangiaceae bacterium]
MRSIPRSPQRLLIFVIAYKAETTLKWVLERIPKSIFEEYACEILVVDDASTDRTFEIGSEYRDAHPEIPITILRNELNQGYGGNQKVGYTYAIEGGFDFVAMVHGDGQYAPEELPRLVAPLRDGDADAVFGSRMLAQGGALRGGMPLYKFLGNKILTTAQNAMLGTKFSEFHSGYRIYSTKALKAIAFKLNSNNFDFDTEIILQLLNAKKRIVELSIPTYCGDEISRVNGMKYAKDILLATAKNSLHRAGLLYQRKFDSTEVGNTHYDLKLGYPSSHTYAIAAVPERARVLDIGGGPGEMASQLVKKGCDAAIVDQFGLGGDGQRRHDIPVFVQNLDAPLTFDSRPYEVLLLLDVIEHLKEPEEFLDRLRAQFDYSPKQLVITTPNVAFIVQRLMLMIGQFNYGKSGILDRTHTRLFTFRGIEQSLKDSGFKIREVRGVPAPFPKVLGNGILGRAAVQVNLALIGVSKTLFSYQIFIVADGTPSVEFLLRDARERSESFEESRKTASDQRGNKRS